MLYGITDAYEALCFDKAIGEFGSWVIEQLNKVEGKNQKQTERMREAKLRSLVQDEDAKRYADPAAIFKKG